MFTKCLICASFADLNPSHLIPHSILTVPCGIVASAHFLGLGDMMPQCCQWWDQNLSLGPWPHEPEPLPDGGISRSCLSDVLWALSQCLPFLEVLMAAPGVLNWAPQSCTGTALQACRARGLQQGPWVVSSSLRRDGGSRRGGDGAVGGEGGSGGEESGHVRIGIKGQRIKSPNWC